VRNVVNAAPKKPTPHAEIRKLQRIQAVLICMQHAANQGAEFDVADALLVVIELMDDALASVDALDVPV
jgi:hypothetical protein